MSLDTHNKTILLIDDDEDEFEIFQLATEMAGLSVELCYINECNKEKLKALPKPDLIFLDINMPQHDGFVWLKGIRERVAEHIPVIMYSTTRNKEKVQQAYNLGANLFITKPDNTGSLSHALNWILHLDWSNPKKLAEESYSTQKFHLFF